jgi:hypothetical protein
MRMAVTSGTDGHSGGKLVKLKYSERFRKHPGIMK